MKAYITKLATYLPTQIVENEINRLSKKTGILRRHIAAKNETAGDMAVCAAQSFFEQGIDIDSVDFLLLCTQSPDYILPATSSLIHQRLQLKTHCGTLDYNHGCSGYVYGLYLAKGLIESNLAKRVLLLTSETYSKHIHPEDNTVLPLFGDAATATLIDAIDTNKEGISGLVLGTDGRGAEDLMIPVGGTRYPYRETPIVETVDKYNNKRTNYHLYMNGSAISEFVLNVVPPMLDTIFAKVNITKQDVDYFVFHQANKFILQYLQQKCCLQDAPYWNDVEEYGNTVSSSIPIALYDLVAQNNVNSLERVCIAGFGVGLSWAGGMVDLSYLQESHGRIAL